jgi:hypothetical protein
MCLSRGIFFIQRENAAVSHVQPLFFIFLVLSIDRVPTELEMKPF